MCAACGRLTWNLMGMMNNPHYRVKVHAATTPDGLLAMRFEHPCLAGGEAGGCAPSRFSCTGAESAFLCPLKTD